MQKGIFTPESYLNGHTVELVRGGEPYFSQLLHLIQEAKQSIHFQVYIFDEDETGKMVAAALKKARKRGVNIYLTVDSYGSKDLSPVFIADLKNHGIHFKYFSPLPEHFYILRMGRRLHHKVVVTDGAIALVGGINIADKYRGSADTAPWLDFAVRIQGPVCVELLRICERIYREKYFGKLKTVGSVPKHPHHGHMRSRAAFNDWFRRKNQTRDGYLAAFKHAQQSITIVASYFLPNRSIRTALKYATRRGVKVNVLLPGKSDVPMAKRATRFLYQWLLRNNIGVYEWNDSILHGKLAVVDNQWATIGSYNLNHLSQYSSIEMNIEVLDTPFATYLEKNLEQLLEQSDHLAPDTFNHNRSNIGKFLDWSSYTLARWIMRILFFFVRREHRYKENDE